VRRTTVSVPHAAHSAEAMKRANKCVPRAMYCAPRQQQWPGQELWRALRLAQRSSGLLILEF
ncbi:hypothetical protein A2U01_0091007, partial [Trifolium medium]|nr:hypothetical protein [Trifolium medium]